MTEEELRLECLIIAAKHYFLRPVGLGMPNDNEIAAIVTKLADCYLHYLKAGNQPTYKELDNLVVRREP